jgi:hypothetical protein
VRIELYIITSPRNVDPLTCPSIGPCTGWLAADTDPAKRPKKAVTGRLEADEYAVVIYNRDTRTVDLTGEIGYYDMSGVKSSEAAGSFARVTGRFEIGPDGKITIFDMKD